MFVWTLGTVNCEHGAWTGHVCFTVLVPMRHRCLCLSQVWCNGAEACCRKAVVFLTRSWLVDVVGAVSIKCQTVTEVFTVVCAWTVGWGHLAVKRDKFSSCSEGTPGSLRQVMLVLLLFCYYIPAHLRPTWHVPANNSLSKISCYKSILYFN